MASDKSEKADKMFEFDEDGDVPASPFDSPRDKKSKLNNSAEADGIPTRASSSTQPTVIVASSPPKFVTLPEIMQAAEGVGNMTLAHEIVVDPDFRFQKEQPPENSLEKRVNDLMRKAFWDVLQEKLSEDPPDYSHALQLLEEVKQRICGLLLPQHARFQTQIDEVLDMQLIKQKIDNNAFDLKYYATFVISIMAKLCAPARDEQVALLLDINDIIPLYKNIFETVDVLRMDMANYTIKHIRPYLQQQSIDYERIKFQQFLDSQKEAGVDGVKCTKSWLERSAAKIFAQQPITEASTSTPADKPPTVTPFTILNNAYLELVQWPENLLFPETVLLDQKRFLVLEKQCNWLSLVTSILLVTYNTVGASIAGITDLKQKLKSLITVLLKGVKESDLDEAMKGLSVQIKKEVNECLVSHGYSGLDEDRSSMLITQIEALSSSQHPVQSLMHERVAGFLKDLLCTNSAKDCRVPAGCSAVSDELSHVAGRFLRLVSHNRSVFGQIYAGILKDILSARENEASEVENTMCS